MSCTPANETIISKDSANEVEELEKGYLTFILNTDTRTYHLSSCDYAKKLPEEIKDTWEYSEDYLISRGYTRCKKCIHWQKN